MSRDHKDVCTLSRKVMFQPLSVPLQNGIRFFLVPVPAAPRADFAACCPSRERYRVSTFHLQKCIGLGACSGPGGLWVTSAYGENAAPTSSTFWFKRQPFALVANHGPYRRFKCFHRTDYLALIRRMAARRVRLSRLIPRTVRCFVALSEPLFIQAPRFTR